MVTDGQASDDFDAAMAKLEHTGWGRNSVRIAIAIGDDADLNMCQKFVANLPENMNGKGVFTPKTASEIQKAIRYLSQLANLPTQPGPKLPDAGQGLPESDFPISGNLLQLPSTSVAPPDDQNTFDDNPKPY